MGLQRRGEPPLSKIFQAMKTHHFAQEMTRTGERGLKERIHHKSEKEGNEVIERKLFQDSCTSQFDQRVASFSCMKSESISPTNPLSDCEAIVLVD
jgi:hypothetical protein